MTVHLEVAEGVGTLRLERPPMNALDVATQDRLKELAEEAARREDVRAVVIYGGEKVFAAGADIKEMQAMDHTAMVLRARALQESFTAVARIPKPVVAAVTVPVQVSRIWFPAPSITNTKGTGHSADY